MSESEREEFAGANKHWPGDFQPASINHVPSDDRLAPHRDLDDRGVPEINSYAPQRDLVRHLPRTRPRQRPEGAGLHQSQSGRSHRHGGLPMSTQHTSSTGPAARNRGYHRDNVRMRIADLVGAYHRHEYRGMQTHALALTGMARRLGADRNVDAQEIEDVPSAAPKLFDAWEDGRADEMSALALGMLDVAKTHKRGGGE